MDGDRPCETIACSDQIKCPVHEPDQRLVDAWKARCRAIRQARS